MTSDAHDFVHTFFKKGAEFTEELLKENEKLRARALELEGENASLRSTVASDQAMRDLMRGRREDPFAFVGTPTPRASAPREWLHHYSLQENGPWLSVTLALFASAGGVTAYSGSTGASASVTFSH